MNGSTARLVFGTEVNGQNVDSQTRCAHWHSDRDVVAIQFPCCEAFFSCISCHEELAGHPSRTWSADQFDRPAILCGACGSLLTIEAYLQGADSCPSCGHAFNPGCRLHRHLYFESTPDKEERPPVGGR